jgi:hypothetical protein
MDYYINNKLKLESILNDRISYFNNKISCINYDNFNLLDNIEKKDMITKSKDLCKFKNIIFYDVESPVYTKDYEFISPSNNNFCKRSRVKSIAYIHDNEKIILIDDSVIFDDDGKYKYIKSKHVCYDFLNILFSIDNPLLIGFNSSSHNLDFKKDNDSNIELSETYESEYDIFEDMTIERSNECVYGVGYDFPAILRSYNYEKEYFNLESIEMKTQFIIMKGSTACYNCILKCNDVYMLDMLPYISWIMERNFKKSEYMEHVGVEGNKLSSWTKYCINKNKKNLVDKYIELYKEYENDIKKIIEDNKYDKCVELNKITKNIEIDKMINEINNTYSKIVLDDSVAEINRALGSHIIGVKGKYNANHILNYNMMDVEVVKYLFYWFGELNDVGVLMNVFDIPFRLALSSNSRISNFLFSKRLYFSSITHRENCKRLFERVNNIYNEFDFQGAIVNVPMQGLQYILLYIDFASLYPNVIIEFNICFTTYIGNSINGIFDEYISIPYKTVKNITTGLDAYYRTDIIGVLPQMMKDYFSARKAFKDLDKSLPIKEGFITNAINSVKLGLNSTYGWIGFDKGNYYVKIIAASVTAGARQAKLDSEIIIKDLNLKIVYGDTDSDIIGFGEIDISTIESDDECIRLINDKCIDRFNDIIKYCNMYKNIEIIKILKPWICEIINHKLRDRGFEYCKFELEDSEGHMYFPGPKKRYVYKENNEIKIKGLQKSKYSKMARLMIMGFIKSMLKDNVNIKDEIKKYLSDIFSKLPLINNSINLNDVLINKDNYIYFTTRITNKNSNIYSTKTVSNGDEITYVHNDIICLSKYSNLHKNNNIGPVFNKLINVSIYEDDSNRKKKAYLYTLPGSSGFNIGFDNEIRLGKLLQINVIRRVLYNMFSWFGFSMLNDNIVYNIGDDGYRCNVSRQLKKKEIKRRVINIWNEFDYTKDEDMNILTNNIYEELMKSIDFEDYNKMQNINTIKGNYCSILKIDGYECVLINDRQQQLKVYHDTKYYYGLSYLCGYQKQRKCVLVGIDIDSYDKEDITLNIFESDIFRYGSQGRKGRHLFIELITDDPNEIFILPSVDKLYVDILEDKEYVVELKGVGVSTNRHKKISLKTLQFVGRHRTDNDFVFEELDGERVVMKDIDFFNMLNNNNMLYVNKDECKNKETKRTYMNITYGKYDTRLHAFVCNNDRSKLVNNIEIIEENNINIELGINNVDETIVSKIVNVLTEFTYEDVWSDYLKCAQLFGGLKDLLSNEEYNLVIEKILIMDEFNRVQNIERRLTNVMKGVYLYSFIFKFGMQNTGLIKRWNKYKMITENTFNDVVDINRELNINDFRCEHKFKIIKANMGTGKTRMFFQYIINDRIHEHSSIVFLTCRNSQIVALANMCDEYGLTYQKIYKDGNYADNRQVYLIQYESLIKYKIDKLESVVLVIDELVSVHKQIICSVNSRKNTDKCYNVEMNLHHYFKLINSVDRCYIMDAFVQQETMTIINEFYTKNQPYELTVNSYKALNPSITYVKNENTFIDRIKQKVNNMEGHKIAICSDTRKAILMLYVNYIQMKRELKVGIIIGQNEVDKEDNSFIKTHNIVLSKYDDVDNSYNVIMYSNAITHTISFYDNFPATILFAHFTYFDIGWEHKMQMLGRPRLATSIQIYNRESNYSKNINKNIIKKKELYYMDYQTKYTQKFINQGVSDVEMINKFVSVLISSDRESKRIGFSVDTLKLAYDNISVSDDIIEVENKKVLDGYVCDGNNGSVFIHQKISRIGSSEVADLDNKIFQISKLFRDTGDSLPNVKNLSIQVTGTRLENIYNKYEEFINSISRHTGEVLKISNNAEKKRHILDMLRKTNQFDINVKVVRINNRTEKTWNIKCIIN